MGYVPPPRGRGPWLAVSHEKRPVRGGLGGYFLLGLLLWWL